MAKGKASGPVKSPEIKLTDAIEDVYYANVYNATVTPHGDVRIDFGQDRPIHKAGGGIKKVERTFNFGLYLPLPVAKLIGEGLLKIVENHEKGREMDQVTISQTIGNA